jgi:hypothetical protein
LLPAFDPADANKLRQYHSVQSFGAACGLGYFKSMYCPRCATENGEATKYCRSCGENLGVVALVMERRLPARLIAKLDEYLEWKNERLRRDSIVSGISGCVFLFLSIYDLVGEGISFSVGFTFVCACALFFLSIWHYLVYQRSLSVNKRSIDLPPVSERDKWSPGNVLNLSAPPNSVTESTTKRVDTSRSDLNLSAPPNSVTESTTKRLDTSRSDGKA